MLEGLSYDVMKADVGGKISECRKHRWISPVIRLFKWKILVFYTIFSLKLSKKNEKEYAFSLA